MRSRSSVQAKVQAASTGGRPERRGWRRRWTRRNVAAATLVVIRRARPGGSVEVMALDLADLASVHRFAEALSSRFDALDLLASNAGGAIPSPQPGRGRLRAGFRHQPPGPLRADRPPAACDALLAEGPGDHRDGRGLSLPGHRLRQSRRLEGYSPARAYSRGKLANVASPMSCSVGCRRQEPGSSVWPAARGGRPKAASRTLSAAA